ncbi:MAG TPA: N-acetylglucosamine-6-phosphate deacetylase [Chloroflexota bacterium]|nr:N-acetylglucosamine-6-phosphate deacetylase [Chloroflexota bacterium]
MPASSSLAIINARLLSPGDAERRVTVLTEAGRISRVLDHGAPIPESAQVIDARGAYLAPGFIDVHVHGGAGSDFMDATPEAIRTVCRFHAGGGTTGLLATTAAAPAGELRHVLGQIAAIQREPTGGAAILGVHMEGPYFAPSKCGCHLPDQVRNPRADEYEPLLDAHPGLVRWMTLAPEVQGGLDLIRALASRGAVPSAGHTEADEDLLLQAIDAGLKHATHLYNAMSTITKRGPYRIPGLVETALSDDRLTVEVIADGFHLAPALLKIAARAKGPDKVLLVTDAMRGAGMPDGTYTFGPLNGTLAIVENGVARTPDNTGFASSTARTCDLVRTMVQRAGCAQIDAVRMASTTPAAALGLDDRKGRVREGYDADLVLLDDTLNVTATIAAGELVYEATPAKAPQPVNASW